MRGARIVGISGLLWVAACAAPNPLPPIEGPEDASLLEGVDGVLLENRGEHELVVVDLPSLARRKLELRGSGWMISGPDTDGRIVYGQDSRVWSRDLNTQRDEVLADLDEPSLMLTTLALAPRGGRVLLGLSARHRSKPGVASEGGLLLHAPEQVAPRSLGSFAVEDVSWFPDGRRAAVEIWVDRSEAEWGDYPQELADVPWSHERRWPTVQVLDCETGHRECIAWGTTPRVSPDGRRLLFMRSAEAPLRLRDLETGAESSLELPGFLRPSLYAGEELIGRCRGWLSDRIVVYDAVPTAGQDPGYVPSGGLQGQYPKWTLKAADVVTRSFRTLVPSVDFDQGYSIGIKGREVVSQAESH